MKWWKTLIAAVLILSAVGITVAGLRPRPPPATEVSVAKVKKGTIVRTITGAGKVQAATTVKISSNLSGDLTELLVKAGDRVSKGQVLGRIDRRRFEAAAKQSQAGQSAARADIQLAQVDVSRVSQEYARVESLVGKGLSSSAELDRARADRDSAAARLASAQQRHAQSAAVLDETLNNLSKTTLLSPIDGTVLELSREVGERVRGSDFSEDVVMTLASLSAMEVKIEVGEHEVVHLKHGQHAEIRVDALEGQSFEGAVTEIAQKALIKNAGTEAELTSFPVTVALATRPPGVLPGMSAEVNISAEIHTDALLVPIQAVTVRPEKSLPDARPQVETSTSLTAKRGGETLAKVVFVVNGDKKATLRRVRTGIASDTDLEVVEGLQEGEQIVEGPFRVISKELNEGDSVKEADPNAKGPKVRG
ncbi:MAG: efflux RND transporter periplasmic adaptor subunit [Myxococcaceae bacterium]